MKKLTTKIIERNRDVEHIMHASCQYGFHAAGKNNIEKQFAMLVTTDVHGCSPQFQSAIEYLNYYDAIDCGICLGDMQPCNFVQEHKWYIECVQKSEKPFLTTLGNHDLGNSPSFNISATPQMAFEKFMQPTIDKIGVEGCDKPYYLRKFEDYKIAILVLNLYDAPDTRDVNGDYVLHRGFEALSQAQVDFIIDALNALPNEYHLLIAMHNFPYRTNVVECNWTQPELGPEIFSDKNNYYEGYLIPDIVNAWMRGESLKREYEPKKQNILPVLKVDCDFTVRGKGVFVGYFVGHYHKDIVAKCAKYEDQTVIYFPSTAMDTWQNECSDLARAEDTKAEDLLTVVSVHTGKREIRLVRIGSNFTMDLKERLCAVFKY